MSEETTETNTNPEGAAPDPGKAKKNGKPRRTRSMGRLAFAFVVEGDTLSGDATMYAVPKGQPEYSLTKDVRDHISELVENDAYEAEFAQHKVQVIRLVGDPVEVKIERTSKVTFG